jgi:L-threonylcarbamoyladenylate synthase
MNFERDIQNCLAQLAMGNTILYPTDTIWGIGCDATNEVAVSKIYSIKKRNEKKSMIILLADIAQIKNYAKPPNAYLLNIINEATKPLTIIYPNAKNLPPNLINEDGTIAVRIVKDAFCETLLHTFEKPIVSTSANISGENSPSNFTEVAETIKQQVDYIVSHKRTEINDAVPSSIIKWVEDETMIVIRP